MAARRFACERSAPSTVELAGWGAEELLSWRGSTVGLGDALLGNRVSRAERSSEGRSEGSFRGERRWCARILVDHLVSIIVVGGYHYMMTERSSSSAKEKA